MGATVRQRAEASHGNDVAASCSTSDATATHGKLSMMCLNVELDASGVPQKVLASDCGKSEQTFSKMRGGVQAFGVEDFGRLPRVVQVAFFKRYGAYIGLRVSEIDPGEVTERLLALVDELGMVAKLARVVTRPLKAKL